MNGMVAEVIVAFFLKYGLIGLAIESFLMGLVFIPGIPEAIIPLFITLKFNPVLVFLAACLGSIAGGVVNYYFGLFGSKVIMKDKKELKRVEGWLNRWGNFSVLVTSFIPGFPFDIVAVLVGFLRMNFNTFLFWMSAGKILKYAIIVFGVEAFLKLAIKFGVL